MTITTRVPFWFVRHGQTDWNKAGLVMGQTDIPLNEHGITQAQAVAAVLAQQSFHMIVSSPLQRAAKTAEIIAEKTNKPLAIIDHFKEGLWGVKQGCSREDTSTWLDTWENSHIEGAESYEGFMLRIRLGMEQAFSYPAPVLIVAHGGVYWAIQKILDIDIVDNISNCVPLFHYHEDNQWKMKEHNIVQK